jgi:hypothetical protein
MFAFHVSADQPNERINCCRAHLSVYTLHGEPLFFQYFDGSYFPTASLQVMLVMAGYRLPLLSSLVPGACRSVHPPTSPHRPRRDPLSPRGRAHDVSRLDICGWVASAYRCGFACWHARRIRCGG